MLYVRKKEKWECILYVQPLVRLAYRYVYISYIVHGEEEDKTTEDIGIQVHITLLTKLL